MSKILYNAIQTPDGTILVSRHNHDYVKYIDKNGKYYSVDGGNCYIKRTCELQDYKELSVSDDGTHKTRRENMSWGINYDKEMNRLPKTEWRKIMYMDSEHIKSILKKGFVENNSFLKEVFVNELKHRGNGHV